MFKPDQLKSQPPRPEDFIDCQNDRTILKWFRTLRQWHRYIRFVGLPQLRDRADIELEELYVEPAFATRHISPDEPPQRWSETQTLLDILTENQRLVVLGDPGSGKSTLVNWITTRLSYGNRDWERRLGMLIPAPIILRELPLDKDITWDRLIEAFLAQEKNRGLPALPEQCLNSGQVLWMLDGLDEIGDIETRQALRDAVLDGMTRYPACRWLMTSRLVGYDEVPFHHVPWEDQDPEPHRFAFPNIYPKVPIPVSPLFYLTPFDDVRIERFAQSWHIRREGAKDKAETDARSLIEAILANEGTHRLARIPNLLTMMALIHRIRARLPHGRVELYNDIAQAYLQTIDEQRKLDLSDFTLDQKMTWLARVAYEMQLRRDGEEAREILVRGEEIHGWITDEMAHTSSTDSKEQAEGFVDYIARRSGLLLPRGEDQYAFMHLSFQEYFCACHLEQELLAPGGPDAMRWQEMRLWTQNPAWHETFILLFERLAARRGWPEHLADQLFGKEFEHIRPWKRREYRSDNISAEVFLAAELTMDVYAGMSQSWRYKAQDACWRWELDHQRKTGALNPNAIGMILMKNDPDEALVEAAKSRFVNTTSLSLSGVTGIREIGPLAQLSKFEHLNLNQTKIDDIAPLASLSNLESLKLSNTEVKDLAPLASLSNLRDLFLSNTEVKDLAPLANLSSFNALDLSNTEVNDLAPLASLSNLKYLDLSNTEVKDLAPLASLSNLNYPNLSNTEVKDLAPLASLSNLRYLYINGSKVKDTSVLSHLEDLFIVY